MVTLDNLVNIAQASGPQVISHYNLFRSAEIDGSAAPGYSTGEGLANMEALAKKNMIQGMTYSWTGLSLEEIEAGGKAVLIFGLGILVVYLTLSAQYESFALPFIILLAVPTAVLGALGLVTLRGLPNDVYCQIGLVMLIGLSAKNSILIVEFAEQIRAQGKSVFEAAIEAAELRLAAYFDDVVCIYSRRAAALFRNRCGGYWTAVCGDHGCRRYVGFDRSEFDIYSSALCDCEVRIGVLRPEEEADWTGGVSG